MNSSRPASDSVDAALERYRRELLVVCYQMLGSPHDAEDAVQETLVRAWRARDRYDPARASVRTWLHRIAFNVSLDALAGRARRPLPSTLVEASDDPRAPLAPAFDVPWLLPIATARFDGDADDPAARAVQNGALRLAFCAAIQWLPPRQRAVLLLCDVLDFSAAEAAEALVTSVPAVNSLLQRGRRALAARTSGADLRIDGVDARLVDRYMAAFVKGDVAMLRSLLVADAVLEMPPVPLWYRGADRYAEFMRRVFELRGTRWRTLPVRANGQAAFGAYVDDGEGAFRAHTVQILSTGAAGIVRNVVYQSGAVFEELGLPVTI